MSAREDHDLIIEEEDDLTNRMGMAVEFDLSFEDRFSGNGELWRTETISLGDLTRLPKKVTNKLCCIIQHVLVQRLSTGLCIEPKPYRNCFVL
ncbi:hypothetical protein CAEBREN_11046 [Caenorhabditis brenneri]|nr:hypothetical protein CAEBREN_11046 [Caenorhabditis brenneri]